MEDTTLDMMKIGDSALIKNINSNSKMKLRMMELGFTKNAEISAIRKSPAGDPTAYLIKGTVVALRESDARNINVSLI